MNRDIAQWMARCLVCQQIKAKHQRPAGPLQSLLIPQWKWENITMDFMIGLPKTFKNNDVVWMIVDRLTKSAHFLSFRVDVSIKRLANMYIDQIVRLHKISVSIVFDRDTRFVSQF